MAVTADASARIGKRSVTANRFPMRAEASAVTAIVMTVNHSVSRLSSLFASSNTRGIISITREFIDQHRGSAVERV
jgi:hypothetical protein